MVTGTTEIGPSCRSSLNECPVPDVLSQAEQLSMGAAALKSRGAELPETPEGFLDHEPPEDRGCT